METLRADVEGVLHDLSANNLRRSRSSDGVVTVMPFTPVCKRGGAGEPHDDRGGQPDAIQEATVTSIVVANIIEFNARTLNDGLSPADREQWHLAGADLSDMALFWEGDDKLVVSPLPFDPDWMTDVQRQLGWRWCRNVAPDRSTDYLCDDILADSRLMGELQRTVASAEHTRLVSWGATAGLYRLSSALRRFGSIGTPELPPPEDYWTTVYLDSKVGFRELCTRLAAVTPSIRVPLGFTCATLDEALDVTGYFFRRCLPFVVKSTFGVSGYGTFVCGPDALLAGEDAVRWRLAAAASEDDTFRVGPVVVEAYVAQRTDTPFGCPTYDAVIRPDGQVRTVGTGALLLEEQFYRGVAVGAGLWSSDMDREIVAFGETVGAEMSAIGYRGWFDIDFIAGVDGLLYATEINARRTSPTHAFELLSLLSTRDRECAVVLANDHFRLPSAGRLSYHHVRRAFADLWQRVPVAGCSWLPTIVTSLRRDEPYLGYAIGGPDYPAVLAARAELEAALMRVCTADAPEPTS